MKCIICDSINIETRDTIISDFVMARIDPNFESERINRKTRLCYCKDCTFGFYEYRLTPEEETLLYKNYRDSRYQETRERYECWYTKKVNDYINTGTVRKQQDAIRALLSEHSFGPFQSALDYGGNQGATLYDELGAVQKYVFDISGVEPIPGVISIRDYEELSKHKYDFIMCNMVFEHLVNPYEVMDTLHTIGDTNTIYYIEVPNENPFTNGSKFSIRRNLSLLFNPHYSWFRLAKYYFQQRKQPFMPMKEHINFFTAQSLRVMAEKSGFAVIKVCERQEGNSSVLAMLFRKENNPA